MQEDRYRAALFCQFFKNEVSRAPNDIRGSLGRALIRFSPTATPQQQRDYVESLHSTIMEGEQLAKNWSDRIVQHHA